MAQRSSAFGNIVATVRAIANGTTAITKEFDLLGDRQRALQERTTYLWQKYQDQDMVEALLAGRYWVGQHAEQLRDALGSPAAVDQKNMATRRREVWKYYPTGVNRYRLRVTIDDDLVATWDNKGN